MLERAPWRAWYYTARWKQLRLQTFERDLFKCRLCAIVEVDSARLVCDHVKPHRGNTVLFWDEANVQTLCKRCHDTVKQRQEQPSRHMRGVWD